MLTANGTGVGKQNKDKGKGGVMRLTPKQFLDALEASEEKTKEGLREEGRQEVVKKLNTLIEQWEQNPYFHELTGHTGYSNGMRKCITELTELKSLIEQDVTASTQPESNTEAIRNDHLRVFWFGLFHNIGGFE